MDNQTFSIRYPLYALKRGDGYVAFDLAAGRPPGKGFGILVFTTEAHVGRYLAHTREEARVQVFDRVNVFRKFLRSLPDPGTLVLFDLLPDPHGNLQTRHPYPAGVVLERFLPEPGGIWGYPVYVLEHPTGLVCVRGEHGGRAGGWLLVYTDDDLADRARAAFAGPVEAVPVADSGAFARLVRALPADIQGVLFDPPDPRRGGRARALSRQHLLGNLEIEI